MSHSAAAKIGYEKCDRPREVPLAVENSVAKVVGYIPAADLEIEGQLLPEKETLGVIEGLREDAVVGLNLIEAYGTELDVKEGKVKIKDYPPKAFLFSS
mgnify:CR=1 FL=1